MKRFFLKLRCKLLGHDYPCMEFSAYTLCFCRHCGQEVAGRTFEDLEPIPDGFLDDCDFGLEDAA